MRSRDPGAVGAVYDAYADRLYAFCWFQLRSRDAAQVALRDTLIVAEAHVGRLRGPDRFGPWLYAIARVECGRRLPPAGRRPDIQIASHDQDDVDQRITAWGAVMALPQLSRELIELQVRHQLSIPDLAAVFAMSSKEVQAALEQARGELGAALTAEILAHEGPYGCPGRAVVLRDRHGELTGELRARLLDHAKECQVCGTFRAGAVSPAKVYGMLPQATPPDTLRLRVMSCFIDPELVTYRLFVADRLEAFAPNGFPLPRRHALPWRGSGDATSGAGARGRRRLHLVGGTAAAVLVVGVALTLVRWVGVAPDHRVGRATASGPTPSVQVPQPPVRPRAQTPPSDSGAGGGGASPVSATFPLGARDSAAPPLAPLPPRDHMRWPVGTPGTPGGGTYSPPNGSPPGWPTDPTPTDPPPTEPGPTESTPAEPTTTPTSSGPIRPPPSDPTPTVTPSPAPSQPSSTPPAEPSRSPAPQPSETSPSAA
ncbi:MAG TPA: sigma-70 family RNA polymerase sigma factor [Streptosporangiaceae bacterium]